MLAIEYALDPKAVQLIHDALGSQGLIFDLENAGALCIFYTRTKADPDLLAKHLLKLLKGKALFGCDDKTFTGNSKSIDLITESNKVVLAEKIKTFINEL